jgi:predicted dehydrogenase
MMKFVVVGCGSIGKRHLGNLQQLGVQEITAVDDREDRCREVEEKFGVPVFASLDDALGHGPQVALICTPTRLHVRHALMAARAGCHLFIEKPLSDSLEGVDELLEEVSQRQLATLVGCNFRFHPGLRHVKVLLDDGAIGKVISARAQFGQYLPDWHPWEDYRFSYSSQRSMGGGVVLDRIHELDYMHWLLGEVTEVYCILGHLSHLEIDTEDTVEMMLRFASGACGSIHLDYVRRTYDCKLEIVGDEGTIQWCYPDHSVRWYLASEARWHSLQWPRYDGNEMYLAEMRHFIACLSGAEHPELDVYEGQRILRLALAAKQSNVEERPIAVEEGET